MAHTVRMVERMALGGGSMWPSGPAAAAGDPLLLRRLTDFAEAGLRAPATAAEEPARPPGGRSRGSRG